MKEYFYYPCSLTGLSTTRIHNEMDQPNLNRRSKCSYCRNEGHDRGKCP